MGDRLTRRDWISACALLSSSVGRAQTAPLTASDVVERIKANVGVPWSERTVDSIIAGDPDTVVRGIATTMMATLDVIERAAAENKNFLVTHESTFFSHRDDVSQLGDDPMYRLKREAIEGHDMVVFHFHDHWHRRRPDGIAVGMARELGWEEYAAEDDPRQFAMPPTKLRALAASVKSKLGADTVRVLGDPDLVIRNVKASWGYVSQFPGIPFAAAEETDLLIVGETREWELVEYVEDMVTSGRSKALILIGHIASEQAGMKYCAEWLESFITEAPITFIPTGEPFWAP